MNTKPTMKTMTMAEFHAACKAQGVEQKEDIAFVCPMCGTVQSARDLIAAGAGSNFNEVEKYLGFSCVGRWLNVGSPRKSPDGKPCNWTLGGLFQLHKMAVITSDGVQHPHFDFATPEQAKAHAASKA